MITGVDSGVEVDLSRGTGLSFKLEEPRPRKLKIVKPGVLVSFLIFAVVPLFCLIASLGVESLSSSLKAVEPHRKFF